MVYAIDLKSILSLLCLVYTGVAQLVEFPSDTRVVEGPSPSPSTYLCGGDVKYEPKNQTKSIRSKSCDVGQARYSEIWLLWRDSRFDDPERKNLRLRTGSGSCKRVIRISGGLS